jgi:predicted MPP superfamily phosphohydrolase
LNFDNYSEVAGLPDKKADLAIGITHAPYLRILDAMSKDNLDLIFAGHTHGGQVLLPFLGRLVVPSRYGTRYAIGVVQEYPKTLFVSPGIGTSILPVRFGVPPEISLLNVE